MQSRTPVKALFDAHGLGPNASRLPDFEQRRAQLLHTLVRERAFPDGWWHGDDLESAVRVMQGRFADLGLVAPLDLKDLQRTAQGHVVQLEGEDVLRRHLIGHVVREANGFLAGLERAHRFYAFASNLPNWNPAEPVWLLLTADERTQLLSAGVLHLASGIERRYDPIATPKLEED